MMRDRHFAFLLAFFGGWLGLQNFYLGNKALGFVCVVFCWTLLPAVFSFFHAIDILCLTKKEFDAKYNKGDLS